MADEVLTITDSGPDNLVVSTDDAPVVQHAQKILERGFALFDEVSPFISEDAPGQLIHLLAQRLIARASNLEQPTSFVLKLLPSRYSLILDSVESFADTLVNLKIIDPAEVVPFAENSDLCHIVWKRVKLAFANK